MARTAMTPCALESCVRVATDRVINIATGNEEARDRADDQAKEQKQEEADHV